MNPACIVLKLAIAIYLYFYVLSDEVLFDSDGDSPAFETGFRVIQTLHANSNSCRNASYGVI